MNFFEDQIPKIDTRNGPPVKMGWVFIMVLILWVAIISIVAILFPGDGYHRLENSVGISAK